MGKEVGSSGIQEDGLEGKMARIGGAVGVLGGGGC